MNVVQQLYDCQGERLEKLSVPCEHCGEPTPWDQVTWVMGYYDNKPYCNEHIEEALTKGRGR